MFLCCSSGCKLLHKKETGEEDNEGADDAEDKDNTRFLSGPVLALRELVNIARDQRVVEGGHFVYYELRVKLLESACHC